MSAALFDRAAALAKQRAQLLQHAAGKPAGDPGRRRALLQARRVERVVVGIAEIIERDAA